MKTEYKYIRFDEEEFKGKTRFFIIRNKRSNAMLGFIKWHGAWKQYCLFTLEKVIFNDSCLEDVQHFIRQLMKDWKESKKDIQVGLE